MNHNVSFLSICHLFCPILKRFKVYMKTYHFVNQSRYLKGFKTHRNITLPLLFRTASFERSLRSFLTIVMLNTFLQGSPYVERFENDYIT